MQYFALILLILFVSCAKKDVRDCNICNITYVMTTDVPVDGYPSTTTMEVELCNQTTDQLKQFEQTNRGSETAVIGGVTYSSSYSTVCIY
ncbi:MAG: hypothetical protein R6W81_12180 [Bacteroidales bacterium]